MKFYIYTFDNYDWNNYLYHKETIEMLNNKEIILLQVYDDIPTQQQVIELTIEELRMLNKYLCSGYDIYEHPLIVLNYVDERKMIFEFQMQSIY